MNFITTSLRLLQKISEAYAQENMPEPEDKRPLLPYLLKVLRKASSIILEAKSTALSTALSSKVATSQKGTERVETAFSQAPKPLKMRILRDGMPTQGSFRWLIVDLTLIRLNFSSHFKSVST